MEPDDLMPNDGTYFFPREPQDQVIARKKEKAMTLKDLTILEDMLERFDGQIDFFESVSSIPDDVRTDPNKFLVMHNSHTRVAEILSNEREYIRGLLETYKK